MFERERKSRAHYEARSRWYDWANRLAALLRGTSGIRERRKPVRRLGLEPAAHLPFADGKFDAVLHHGGFAEFGNKRGALAEMMRVVKPAGKVVVCDAGIPEDRQISLVNRLILFTQPEYKVPPPMDLLPAGAQDVRLSWYFRGGWYIIEFYRPL